MSKLVKVQSKTDSGEVYVDEIENNKVAIFSINMSPLIKAYINQKELKGCQVIDEHLSICEKSI